MNRFIFILACCVCFVAPAWADTDVGKIEFLTGDITPETSKYLIGLACRNFGWIVHLNIKLDWPEKDIRIENQFYRDTLVLKYHGSKETVNDIENDPDINFNIISDQTVHLKEHYRIDGYYFILNGSGNHGVWEIMLYPVEREPNLPEIQKTDSYCKPPDISPDIH